MITLKKSPLLALGLLLFFAFTFAGCQEKDESVIYTPSLHLLGLQK